MCHNIQSKPFRLSPPIPRALPYGFLLCVVFSVFLTEVTAAQPVSDDLTFPYQAIVSKDDAQVRSGPGIVHYATGKLAQNSTAEVYRHDPGGWCAIRPTAGCFSLIPESAIEIIEAGIGEVTEDGTQAWVGTELGPVEKPLWQIKLKKGEMVDVIGQASWPNPEGHSTTWYQVSPPAGEFRWIHISDLQLPPSLEQLVTPTQSIVRSQPAAALASNTGIAGANPRDGQVRQATYQSEISVKPPAFPRTLNDVNQGWRQASREDRKDRFNSGNQATGARDANDSLGNESAVSHFSQPPIDNSNPYGNLANSLMPGYAPERLASANVNSRFDLEQLNQRPYSGNSGFGIPGLPAAAMGTNSSLPLSVRLSELEFKLSNEMIKEPNQWRLIDLQTVADSIYQSTSDPRERLQAQQLLKKLENCRKIRSGYLEAYRAGGAAVNGLVGSGVATEELVSLSTTYDAMGWLNELVRDGGTSKSTYVLQDDNGKITHHLSPGPGLNLHGYLKSKIGVIGQRGYHNTLDLNHVTVERVVELEKKNNPGRRVWLRAYIQVGFTSTQRANET